MSYDVPWRLAVEYICLQKEKIVQPCSPSKGCVIIYRLRPIVWEIMAE